MLFEFLVKTWISKCYLSISVYLIDWLARFAFNSVNITPSDWWKFWSVIIAFDSMIWDANNEIGNVNSSPKAFQFIQSLVVVGCLVGDCCWCDNYQLYQWITLNASGIHKSKLSTPVFFLQLDEFVRFLFSIQTELWHFDFSINIFILNRKT